MRAAIASSYDLAGLQKPCENAFKLYLKTRPPAVPESIKRARTLPRVRRWVRNGQAAIPGPAFCGAACDDAMYLTVRVRPAFRGCVRDPCFHATTQSRGPPSAQEGMHPLLAAAIPSAALGGMEAQVRQGWLGERRGRPRSMRSDAQSGAATRSAQEWQPVHASCPSRQTLQESLAAFTSALKSYRPSQTVFEAEMAPARRGEGAGEFQPVGCRAARGPA